MAREALAERMLRDQMVADDPAGHEVLLDNTFQHRRIALRVPGAVRVDDGDRPAFANAQAVRFGPQDAALLRQAQFLETPFEECPRLEAAILVTAFRLVLVAAEKDVPPRDR